MDMIISPPEPPNQALVSMTESRYGFSCVDLQLADEDIALFDSMDISRPICYNLMGSLTDFEREIYPILAAFGENGKELLEPLALRVGQIARQVFDASGQPFGWFCLRASLPPDAQRLKRWHMDGLHYMSDGMQYKFCYTIQGDSTLFYPLSTDLTHMRRVIWQNMNDVEFTNEFCQKELIFTPDRKEGIFFLMAKSENAALHVEPPVDKPRLFFSIVPCKKVHLPQIQARLQLYYPPSEREIYLLF